ncbi:MAG: hypothetical protein ACOVQ4_02525 [Flectobacillus sp.]|uniref:hypothetical protein n=1 Tax=Flectobacillus sp. TaxID=50419 RepID=UPI003B9D071B
MNIQIIQNHFLLKKALIILLSITLLPLVVNIAKGQKKANQEKTFTLIVEREKNKLIGRFANIYLFFNEQAIGSVENGETKTFTLRSTKSGHAIFRAESNDIAIAGIIDTSLVSRFRKELRIKTNSGNKVKIFCTYNESGIYVREVEL